MKTKQEKIEIFLNICLIVIPISYIIQTFAINNNKIDILLIILKALNIIYWVNIFFNYFEIFLECNISFPDNAFKEKS